MPNKSQDRVKETTTTTGTGNITLAGAVSGFQTFASRYAVGQLLHYAIVLGTEWEVGVGSLSGASTLVRTQVFESSNADALVNFSAGTKDVFVTIPANYMNKMQTRGQLAAAIAGWSLP